jgi:acyl-CoA dehydrogenase
MNFEHSDKVNGLIRQVRDFMEEHILPNEDVFNEQIAQNPWATPPIT